MKRLAILVITLSCLAGLLCLAPDTETEWAQSSWNDGNNNWNTTGNWSPVGVPNSSTMDVSITKGTSSTPTTYGDFAYLDGSTVAGAVTINGTYTSDLSTDTYLLGTINNKGNIQDFF